jgi:hypothetical protein
MSANNNPRKTFFIPSNLQISISPCRSGEIFRFEGNLAAVTGNTKLSAFLKPVRPKIWLSFSYSLSVAVSEDNTLTLIRRLSQYSLSFTQDGCYHLGPAQLLKEPRVGVKAGSVQNRVLSPMEPGNMDISMMQGSR